MQRKLRLKKDSEDDSNCPQNNFSEYLYRFQDPLKLRETLKAGFLFSLPGQNPNAAGGPGTCLRLTKFVHQPLDQQLKHVASQAWKSLSSPPVIPKNRVQPGVTGPIDASSAQKFVTGSSYQPKQSFSNLKGRRRRQQQISHQRCWSEAGKPVQLLHVEVWYS